MIEEVEFAKKLILSVIGFTILLIGVALIVLPGPAFIVIPFGLLMLSGQFVWARRLLKRIKSTEKYIAEKFTF